MHCYFSQKEHNLSQFISGLRTLLVFCQNICFLSLCLSSPCVADRGIAYTQLEAAVALGREAEASSIDSKIMWCFLLIHFPILAPLLSAVVNKQSYTQTVFLTFKEPRNLFRQPMQPGGPVTTTLFLLGSLAPIGCSKIPALCSGTFDLPFFLKCGNSYVIKNFNSQRLYK